jgi:hypothetical protein
MKRFLFTAALLAIWTNLGFAQTKEIQEQLDKQLKDLRTEDELLRQALASHPDVMVAQAKRQVAEAELAQVKLAVAQKLSKLKSELFIEENALATARKKLDRLLELRKKGTVNEQEVLDAELKVQFSQANLSHITTELQEVMPNPKSPSSQHPDVLVATAKLRVADAELAQTKLVISQKIAILKAEINGHKQTLSALESVYKDVQNMQAQGVSSKAEVLLHQIRFLESRNTVSRLQSVLKSMTELKPSQAEARPPMNQFLGDAYNGIGDSPIVAQTLLKAVAANRPAGSAAEKLTAVLDKKVKFEAKAQPAAEVIKSLKEKYALDLTIRMPLLEKDGGFPLERITLSVSPGDMTFTTWLELIMDDLNSKINQEDMKFVAYVREYGLLITPTKLVPQDAVTLKEFARQVRAEYDRAKEKEKAATEPLKP